ncbi:MAG: tRNA (guanosine(37)-N1)-methyltransferase TrmD [Eubacteriales bacterium]|nr:tRNA (guanosine(37)-N1)-methyltransferase TrmD [Eubacteriales bacterium]
MRFDIMTLFPGLIESVLSESIIGRARRAGFISVNTYNIRDYSRDKHHRVDDTPYGGGMGMLMMAPPVYDCYQAVLADKDGQSQVPTELRCEDEAQTEDILPDEARDTQNVRTSERRRVIYMSPKGRVLTQNRAAELASDYDRLIILCGHYEGIDQRVLDEIVDEDISIGDYVLTGGEIPACILVDCVARLCPGVLADDACFRDESLTDNLLEYPQYTRPYEFHGVKVPDVLISGHHANIDKWRHEEALMLTQAKRPDLLNREEEDC